MKYIYDNKHTTSDGCNTEKTNAMDTEEGNPKKVTGDSREVTMIDGDSNESLEENDAFDVETGCH